MTTPAYADRLVMMPRRFEASVPIYLSFPLGEGLRQLHPDWDEFPQIRELIYSQWAGTWAGEDASDAIATDPWLQRAADSHWPVVHDLLYDVIEEVYLLVGEIPLVANDALDVDDFFLAWINPDVYDRMKSFVFRRRELAGTRHEVELLAALEEMVSDAPWPPFTDKALGVAVSAEPETSYNYRIPCAHSRGHQWFQGLKPGPRRNVIRRASTWGTYVLAWAMGCETTAVRVWNRLFLPARCRWGGPGASLATSVSKYTDAKRALVEDLIAWNVMPPSSNSAQPNPPIAREAAELLIRMIEARTRVRVTAALTGAWPAGVSWRGLVSEFRFGHVLPPKPPKLPRHKLRQL